jgi:cold shock CspA family protein/ribosome-associated translation inhibitor RaiA
MRIPLDVDFRNMDRSEALEADVRRHAEKLEELFDRMISCRVVVEAPHRHHRKGNIYHVRILVSVPRKQLVVDREPHENHAHEDPYIAVHDSFKSMRRQLEAYAREIRGDVKLHASPPHGKVVQIIPEEDHGFIETPDGRTIYFHRNAVLETTFEQLEPGAEVRFEEEQGDEGPQASTVRPVGRHHHLVD